MKSTRRPFATVNWNMQNVGFFLFQLWIESNHLEYRRCNFRGWEYLHRTKIKWHLCKRVRSSGYHFLHLFIYSLRGQLTSGSSHPLKTRVTELMACINKAVLLVRRFWDLDNLLWVCAKNSQPFWKLVSPLIFKYSLIRLNSRLTQNKIRSSAIHLVWVQNRVQNFMG